MRACSAPSLCSRTPDRHCSRLRRKPGMSWSPRGRAILRGGTASRDLLRPCGRHDHDARGIGRRGSKTRRNAGLRGDAHARGETTVNEREQILEILRKAYQIEVDGYTFYSMTAMQATKPAVKELFEKL